MNGPVFQVIRIEPAAPVKPALGAPCNGCGICCLAEPCPLGVLLSRKRRGACDALLWADGQYRCGAVQAPRQTAEKAFPIWLAAPLAWALARLARRWIAAGIGCDSSLEPQSATIQP